MSDTSEPWIGICQFSLGGEGPGRRVEGLSAVWCDGREDFNLLLDRFARQHGHRLEWSEQVHRAGYWLARFSAPDAENLALAVNQAAPCAIGTLRNLGDVAEGEELAPLLVIEELGIVVPLGAQFGVADPVFLPEGLAQPLFGQPEPSNAEGTRNAASEEVPPLNTYAVLDAAKVPHLALYLEEAGLPHMCLFKGEAADELGDVAPYIVELKEDCAFTRQLFTEAGMPSNLWVKRPGMIVRSREPLAAMQRHFRRFTRVQDANDKWYFYRFWESTALITVAQASSREDVRRLFTPDMIVFARRHTGDGDMIVKAYLAGAEHADGGDAAVAGEAQGPLATVEAGQ